MIILLKGEKVERSHEINCHSLGFHAILDMRDTSSVGWTQSCTLGKGEENRAKEIAPVYGFTGFQASILVESGLDFVDHTKMLITNVNTLNKISLNTP